MDFWQLKKLLKKYQIYPLKRLGQNFLINKGVIRKMLEAAGLSTKDTVLEIGPGFGILTIELAKNVKKVVAVEKDKKLAETLKENLKNLKNVKIIEEDILKILKAKPLVPNSYKVVANIPYYLTSRLIRNLLERKNKPKEIILMVQKEVAKRICASPPDMNLLAVSVQFYARPKIISFISKKSFWPQPKVDSAILQIAPLINADGKLADADLFFKVVRAGFSQPRKQLINNFKRGLKMKREVVENWLLKNNIQPSQRAETLTVESWISLTKSFKIE